MSEPKPIRNVSIWLIDQNANERPAISGYTRDFYIPIEKVNQTEAVYRFYSDRELNVPITVNTSRVLYCMSAEIIPIPN